MALTGFQQSVCRLIAQHRIASGESYVAGGVALNALTGSNRISRDIDLFHDTETALQTTWEADHKLLAANAYQVDVIRERPAYVEATVSRSGESVLMQWARDSAYRFFPLMTHPEFGLTLHPFDLATNKVLALVGRLEARDWVDLIGCHLRVQPLGYLVWAACGKDPGFSPHAILEHARRSAHYSAAEIAALAFAGSPPDAAALAQQWRAMLAEAHEIVTILPVEEAGKCVLDTSGQLFAGGVDQLRATLSADALRFHAGCVRGAWPQIVSSSAES